MTMAAEVATPTEEARIQAWVEQFHRDGYLVLHDLLPPDLMAEARADLDRELAANNEAGDGAIQLHHRMFESSPANLKIFDHEPVVTFAEALVSPSCHVIH